MSQASIASDKDAWISARAAALILGISGIDIEKVLLAAKVRRKAIPGRVFATWYKPDVEAVAASCVSGGEGEAAPLTQGPGAGEIGGSGNAESVPCRARSKRESGSLPEGRRTSESINDHPVLGRSNRVVEPTR